MVIKIRPEYPRWFTPMANLAETKPGITLLALLGSLSAVFGAGFLAAWLLK